jgi:hypothetical protein
VVQNIKVWKGETVMAEIAEFVLELKRYLAVNRGYATGDVDEFCDWFNADSDILCNNGTLMRELIDVIAAKEDNYLAHFAFRYDFEDEDMSSPQRGKRVPAMVDVYDIGPIIVMCGAGMEAIVSCKEKLPKIKNFRWTAKLEDVLPEHQSLMTVMNAPDTLPRVKRLPWRYFSLIADEFSEA